MSFCQNCGAQLAQGATFCTNCGHAVSGATPPPPPTSVPPAPPTTTMAIPPGGVPFPTQAPPPAYPAGPPPDLASLQTQAYGQRPAAAGPYGAPPPTVAYGAPYGAPVSAAPYGPPVSAAPYGAAPYPTGYPAAQPPKKGLSGGTIAAIVGGVAAIGLVAAGGVTAFVVLSGAPLRDCVVGSWKATSFVMDYADSGRTTIDGVRMQWKSSGASTIFFTGAAQTDESGDTVELGGTATFSYTIDGDEISYTNGRGNAGEEWLVEYSESASCDGDDLSLTGKTSGAEWTVKLARE